MDKRTIDVNGIIFNMLPVEGGQFVMGATSEQHGDAYDNEAPAHSVRVDDYYLGETVVTQALWDAVMDDTTEENPELPVTGKSWSECQAFIRKLNDLTSRHFRMPTEAEWEYAARGGKKGRGCKYAGSNNLDDVAWYDKNSGRVIHPAKQKRPNELGLYDMSGNVWEWCADWYGEYERAEEGEEETAHNPQGPRRGGQRVVRGASSNYYAQSCRVSCRLPLDPLGNPSTGFRLAMDVEEQEQPIAGGAAAMGAAETPMAQPLGGKTGKATPVGAGKKSASERGNYWKASGGGTRRKKKVWPWIVGPIGGFFLLLIIIAIASHKNGANSGQTTNNGTTDTSTVQTPTKPKEPNKPELSTEDIDQKFWQYFNTSGTLFAKNKLEINVDKDYTSKIKELSNGWNYLLKADSTNNNLKTLNDTTYWNNCEQIKEIKDSYKDHFQEVYNKECQGLTQLFKGGNYPESYKSTIDDYIKRIKQLKEFSGFDMIKSDSIAEKIIIENTK